MRVLATALTTLLLAACSTVDAETPRDAAVWTSGDGLNWERVHAPVLAGPGEQQMTAADCIDDGVVVAGTEVVDGERDAVVWWSGDGNEWTRSDAEDLGGAGEQWIWDIASTSLGLVAVGSSGSATDQDAAIWFSSDGVDWARVDVVPSFGGVGHQFARAVTQYSNEIVVAGEDNGDGAAWTSEDGLSWLPMAAPSLGGEEHQTIAHLAPGGPGLIATGESQNDAAVWTFDGSTWIPSEDSDALGGPGRQAMDDVVATGDGWVAVGGEFTYDEIFLRGGSRGTFDGAVWTSADTVAWERVEGADAFAGVGDQTVAALTEWDGGLVAVGHDLAGRGTVEEGGLPFGSGEDVDAAVWLSDDGVTWVRVTSPVLGGEDWQDMYDVVACPGTGLVAVGGDDLGTPPA